MTLDSAGRGGGRLPTLGLALGPLLFLAALLLPLPDIAPEARRTLAVTLLVATFWLTEALPIPVTALLPVVLLPLLRVAPSREVATAYANDAVFLFLGGFLLALAIERCGLHRRLAAAILARFGGTTGRLSLSFMVVAAAASAWISNTAATLVLLPMALAVIGHVEERADKADAAQAAALPRFGALVLLGIAYGASIGGLATPIGTPPNVIFLGQVSRLYPDRPDMQISFATWLAALLPLVVVFVPIAWLVLSRLALPCGALQPVVAAVRATRRERSGPLSRDEKVVAAVFTMAALGWVLREEVAIGALRIPGWSNVFGVAGLVHDSTVALAAAVLLFVLPSQRKGERLLDWSVEPRLPWGVLILLGGGFALAAAFESSGLSAWFGDGFARHLPESRAVAAVSTCLAVTFLTEVTSNTATASVLLPILGGIAVAAGHHPFLLMLPATISASCAFMLPVATPPNAIVFGSGRVSIGQMVRAGLLLNLAGAVLITCALLLWWTPLLRLGS